MRPKIIISLLLVGVIGFAVIFFLKPSAKQSQPEATPLAQPVVALEKTNPVASQLIPITTNPAAAAPPRLVKSGPFTTGQVVGENAEFLQAQIDRLEALEANNDNASLQAILKELTNTNRIIRHVAIESTIQFGGHTAVPILQELAARTADPNEKQELLDAAEFLALPTLTEVRAQNPGVKIVMPPNSSPTPGQP